MGQEYVGPNFPATAEVHAQNHMPSSESGKPLKLDLQEVCLVNVLGKVVEFCLVDDAKQMFLNDLPGSCDLLRCRIGRSHINRVLSSLMNHAAKSARGPRCSRRPDSLAAAVRKQEYRRAARYGPRLYDPG